MTTKSQDNQDMGELRAALHERTGQWINKNVDSRLGFVNWTNGHNNLTDFVLNEIAQSQTHLLANIEAGLPEKEDNAPFPDDVMYGREMGYNEALDQVKQILKEQGVK